MRQLAAILFADMSGYTALMQDNEHLARLKRKRFKEVLESTIEKHEGKLLQNYGDGSLSIFSSAINSVSCAVAMQQQLQLEPKVEVRIGIHTGDVVVEEEAIYGDGVNLASRVESLAVPGGIFISEKVFDEIKNHDNIKTRDMGFFELKNVKQPVHLYAIANEGIIVPSRDELKGKTKQPANRLAVLPFVNMSADPDNEYFSDGITEELLNTLTKVDGLQVTSRTSAFAFKGKQDDIREIAIKLNVDKVLEGSVRKAGNRVRITAQLINAADGYHIWSETYDRNLTDIFEVQDEISNIITNRLRENLSIAQQAGHIVKSPVKNIEAYTLFLKALHFRSKITPADMLKAIDLFEQAIQIEPGYAEAYAYIAGTYSYLGATGQVKPEKAFGIVNTYSEKAMQLNDKIAESHLAKANAHMFYKWNPKAAYDSLQKAIQLNPAQSEAYDLLGLYYILTGKKEEAVKILSKAIATDPLSPTLNHMLAEAYMMVMQYDEALHIADRMLEMNPQMRIAIETRGWCFGLKGDWEKAVECFKEVHRLTNHPLKGLAPLGFAWGMLGEKEKALEVIEKIQQRQKQEPDAVLDGDLMIVWWSLRDFEKVHYYLEKCIEYETGPFTYIVELPMLKGIEEDPRIAALLKKIRERFTA
ncbi:MAG: adenylate/guanylate cyclase domain-containing protein [Chitinophagaceae bacterium]|nr:adenylate/guanylate cyclase domain-containing protein [Chitinophagaceae bacterium]